MAQQRSRKVVRVVLAAGAPIVAAVLGVSLGWAGGSARADNGQPIILGAAAACGGTGTNCESSTTQIENTGIGPVVQALQRTAQWRCTARTTRMPRPSVAPPPYGQWCRRRRRRSHRLRRRQRRARGDL